jgi:uncharacterized repeat protein (TIGR03806 family)
MPKILSLLCRSLLPAFFCLGVAAGFSQTVFLDFNTPGQYASNFNSWNDNGGINAGDYSFEENTTAGVGGSGGISNFQSTDMTATYKSGSWNFATNGATILVSTLIYAAGGNNGDKIQLGVINSTTNGLNGNTGVEFESFRFIPTSTTAWGVYEQYNTGNATTNSDTLGNVTVTAGHWYKFVVGVTNTSGASGNVTASCALFDYGADGLTPGNNLITFSTVESHAAMGIATNTTVWPALRITANAAVNAWDDFLVFQSNSQPVITLKLTNSVVASGGTAIFNALADGPDTIAYSWYSNNIPVSGATDPVYTVPVVGAGFTNLMVVAGNSNGSVTNSATVSVVVPGLPQVTNAPATAIAATFATLNGQIISTGGATTGVMLYYGVVDGGNNAGMWSHSISLGVRSGSFSQTISGLSTNTAYYFTAEATNLQGAAWAAPSQTFTTASSDPVSTSVPVLTYHNDNARLGANTNETILTLANVNTNSFGRLFTYTVDGFIYAQPLIMTNVIIPGKGTHNVVIVATEHNSVYAFDADDNSGDNATPLWQTSFINPAAGITTVPNGDVGTSDITPEIGITSTPVIDPATGTIYVEVKTKEPGPVYVHRLHALDIATGLERTNFNSPAVISCTNYPGSGNGDNDGRNPPHVLWNPLREHSRPALTLLNGVIYISFASHGDNQPYHGWFFGYNATNVAQQVGAFNSTPNGVEGGFWDAGDGPTVDAQGNLYFQTGNGTFDGGTTISAASDYAMSILKFATTNGLTLVDYFAPSNAVSLSNGDADLGSGAPLALPDSAGSVAHPHLVVGGGKTSPVYVVDRDNMGRFNGTSGKNLIVQQFNGAWGGGGGVSPTFFNNTLYIFDSNAKIGAYTITNGLFNTTPVEAPDNYPNRNGVSISISANGTSNAIAWALYNDGSESPATPCILRAYNATNLAQKLYSSDQLSTRDAGDTAVKMTIPTIANGKVYVGAQYALDVYGLAANFVNTPIITPNGGVFTNSVTVSLSDSTVGAAIYYTLDGTTPTTSSMLYSKPFTLTDSGSVMAKAFATGSVASGTASASFINSSAIGSGDGLLGQYWSNTTSLAFTNAGFNTAPTLTRVDPTINFNWDTGSPDPSISVDHFITRWTGSVQPQFNETYTFYTTTDDGVRLWVNGRLLIDEWVDQGPTEWSGSITLAAHQRYNIQMDYYEDGGGAAASLSWSSPSTTKAIIPQTQLYAVTNPPPVVILTSPTNNATYTASASVSMSADAAAQFNTLDHVTFYVGTALLGSVSNSPDAPLYTLTATGLAAGSYTLTAVAVDGSGLSSTSAPVNISVAAGSGLPYGLTPVGNTSPAQLIDVQFNGNSVSTANAGGGPDPGPVQSGAALIGSAGDIWNAFDDSSLTFSGFPDGISADGLALNYVDGNASGVTMSLTADETYDAESFGNNSPFVVADSPYQNLMQAELVANNPQTITLSGLGANQAYDLILYSSGDNNVGTGRTNTFTVNGVTQTSIWNGTDSTFIAGQTYVEFPSAMTDGSGNLVIHFGVTGGNGGLETDLNGFQLVAVSGNSTGEVPAFFNMPTTMPASLPGTLPLLLSETGVFSNTPSMTPTNGLIPYRPNVILWSDGAQKIRYMAVPNNGGTITPDQQIAFAPTGTWTFPAGTIFVKTFELQTNESDPNSLRRLETRLLVRDVNGTVYGVTYKWRPDDSDADLLTTSSNENIAITTPDGVVTQTWYYPSPADCLTCHTPVAKYVLGVSTRQLNDTFTYPSTGVTDNELRTLNRLGLFNPAFDESSITNFEKLSALTNLTASLQDRARSYLDANCAQCHQPGGSGPTFDARYETPLTNQNIIYGVLSKGDLGYDHAYVVVPQDTWRSVLYDRMNTVDPTIKMPNLARNMIDTNAVQVFADWINSLSGIPALAPPTITPDGGTFGSSVNVSLQSPDTNAAIYYTLDGTLPTTNSFLYSGVFNLTNSATLMASAFETNYDNSVAASALFTVEPLNFTSAGFSDNNIFQMGFLGAPGNSYVLEASTNLTDWTPLLTNLATTNVFNLVDPDATNFPYRFYRVQQQ